MTDEEEIDDGMVNTVYGIVCLALGDADAAEDICVTAVAKAARCGGNILSDSLRYAYRLGKRAACHAAYQKQHSSELYEMLGLLRYKERFVLLLRHKAGLNAADISLITGMSSQCQGKSLCRLYRKLSDKYTADDNYPCKR